MIFGFFQISSSGLIFEKKNLKPALVGNTSQKTVNSVLKRKAQNYLFKNVTIEKFRKQFCFFHLHFTWLFVSWKPKEFWKKSPFEIWELVSLGGVKTHFGILALKKYCIFRHKKINIVLLLSTSVLWKILM